MGAVGTSSNQGLANNFALRNSDNPPGIYVLLQTGENKITPARMNLSPEVAAIFAQQAGHVSEFLDPQKIKASMDKAGVDSSVVDLNSRYLSQPTVVETVRLGFNSAMDNAVNAYNDLAKEYGASPVEQFKAVDDIVKDNQALVKNWTGLDMMITPLQDLARQNPHSTSDDFQEKVDALQSARESLDYYGGLAQETAIVVQNNSAGENFKPINWEQFEYDNPEDAYKLDGNKMH